MSSIVKSKAKESRQPAFGDTCPILGYTQILRTYRSIVIRFSAVCQTLGKNCSQNSANKLCVSKQIWPCLAPLWWEVSEVRDSGPFVDPKGPSCALLRCSRSCDGNGTPLPLPLPPARVFRRRQHPGAAARPRRTGGCCARTVRREKPHDLAAATRGPLWVFGPPDQSEKLGQLPLLQKVAL